MNVGEKISLYKEKLGHKNYQSFAKSAGVPGSWLNDLSKKDDIGLVDMHNVVKLCDYLGITINQLVIDEELVNSVSVSEITNINQQCDDIGVIISEMIFLLDKEDIKLNGMLLNNTAKQICKDALEVVEILTKQYL